MALSAPVLDEGGIMLKVLELSDAQTWKDGEDSEQIRWFEAPGPAPMANIREAISNWRENWRADGPVRHWGIWVEDRLAGGVELRVREDGLASVSYLVFPGARRQHVASRAVRLAARWAFDELGVPAIVAIVNEQNTASRGVAETVGFCLSGPAEPWEHSETGTMLRYVLEAPG